MRKKEESTNPFVALSNPKARRRSKTVEKLEETENDYLVEYISDEVKNEVENAQRRRQEAEQRISMEKVSETIRNLKGIEVVPVKENPIKRNDRIGRIKQNEEIILFPVNTSRKRHGMIETIVIDDYLTVEKRLKQIDESMLEKNEEEDEKRDDFVVFEENKKLNFSTVGNDRDLRIEPKEEKSGDYYFRGQFSACIDTVIDLTEESEKEELENRYSVIEIDENGLEKVEEEKIGDSYLERQLFCLSEKRNDKLASIFNMEIDTSKILNETLEDYEIVKESTVGRIISGIDDNSNVDDNNEAEEEEEEVVILSYNDLEDKSCPIFGFNRKESEKFERLDDSTEKRADRIVNEKMNEKSLNDSIPLKELIIRDSSSVDSSGKEKSTINLINYKQPEGSEKDSLPIDEIDSQQEFAKPNSTIYQCTICSTNFASMPTVLKHNVEDHMSEESPFSCLICDKGFDNKLSLVIHVDEHNNSNPFNCTFCPKKFTLQRNLKRHINQHINYKPYQCGVCLKRFSEDSSLKSHAYLHTGDSPFSCKICNVSFNKKTNWRRHVITTHEKLTAVSCKYCGKELPDKRSLDVHVRVHTGDKPYQCSYCGKRFTQQCNLNTHIHCHLNDRPFVCPHCGKGFNQRGTRDDHILTHTGERPHKCTECKASFTVGSALKRHMWIHSSKDRPHNCEKCDLRFVGLYELKRHVKIHHGEAEGPSFYGGKNKKRENEGYGIFGESEADLNGARKFERVQPCGRAESGGLKIQAKEDGGSPIHCRLTNFTDLQTETKDQSSLGIGTKNLIMNCTKTEEFESNSYSSPEVGIREC